MSARGAMLWHLLYDWQTLIAGMLGLAGGLIAYGGAIRAANRQVAAIQEQIGDARQTRTTADERRTSAVKLAIRLEAQRITVAAEVRRHALPGGPQMFRLPKTRLVIESSPILRGEREDISVLDIVTQECLAALASALADYNSHIETLGTSGDGMSTALVPDTFVKIDNLRSAAKELAAVA